MDARNKLITAARECLLAKGQGISSVKAIAERAGVNHGLVHHYFGSKEGLWIAVIEQEAERLRGSLPTQGAGFVRSFLLPEIVHHPDRIRLAIEFLALAKQYPRISNRLADVFRLRREEMRRLLGIDDPVRITLVFGALFGMAIQYQLDATLPVAAAAEWLVTQVQRPEQPPQPSSRATHSNPRSR